MRRFIEKLEFIRWSDIAAIFVMLAAIPGALLLRRRRPHMWLLCEDRMEARDNGYWLFKYICENEPDTDVVYALDPSSADYAKVVALGREVIPFGGYTHWKYYMAAGKNVSSQKNGKPNAAVCYLLEVYGIWRNKRAFLQHGVIMNQNDFLFYENTKMSLFVCGARDEYEYVKSTFGYPDGAVQYLGLARFDGLHDVNVKKNQVLVMPTWREWIATPSSKSKKLDDMTSFQTTEYYRRWKEFLASEKLEEILEKYDLHLVFFPHRNMQSFLHYFAVDTDRIELGDWKKYDVQQLLKESAYLITDYSSIFMDFAYMRKPMLYYQFDYEKFRAGQYPEGYFSYKKDGFGPVCETLPALLGRLEQAAGEGLANDPLYIERESQFFDLYDTDNCKRNYEAIKEL